MPAMVKHGCQLVIIVHLQHQNKVSFNMFQTEKVAEKEAILQHKKEFMVARQQDDVKKMMHRQVKHLLALNFLVTFLCIL